MAHQRRELPVAPPGLWERAEMRTALSERDMGAVIRIFRRWTGASQTDISVLTGVPQPDVSDLERGTRHVTAMDLFERFADGLCIPRPLLGLADRQPATSPQPVSWKAGIDFRSVSFIEWIAEHSSLSVREAHDRLATGIGEIWNLPEGCGTSVPTRALISPATSSLPPSSATTLPHPMRGTGSTRRESAATP